MTRALPAISGSIPEGSTDRSHAPAGRRRTTMDVLDYEAALMDAREEERLRRSLDADRWCRESDVGDALTLAAVVAAVLTEVCRGV